MRSSLPSTASGMPTVMPKQGKFDFLTVFRTEVIFVLVAILESFRFEDEDENDDQVLLLLIVRMLKSVAVMA